jgi:hypothetical protein
MYPDTLTVAVHFHPTGQLRGFAFHITEPIRGGRKTDVHLDPTRYATQDNEVDEVDEVDNAEEVSEDDKRSDPDDELLLWDGLREIQEHAARAANLAGASPGSIYRSAVNFAIEWRDKALDRPCVREARSSGPGFSTFPRLPALLTCCSQSQSLTPPVIYFWQDSRLS